MAESGSGKMDSALHQGIFLKSSPTLLILNKQETNMICQELQEKFPSCSVYLEEAYSAGGNVKCRGIPAVEQSPFHLRMPPSHSAVFKLSSVVTKSH